MIWHREFGSLRCHSVTVVRVPSAVDGLMRQETVADR